MFTEWLLNNQGLANHTGRAAQIVWTEMNNGFVPRGEHGLLYWRDHLVRRAGQQKGDTLFKDFLLAYMDFKNEGY